MSSARHRYGEDEHTSGTSQTTRWLGQEWSETLDTARPLYARAVQQGEALLRRGAVQQMEFDAGRVGAYVIGEREGDVEVEITVDVFDDESWSLVTTALAERLRFTAALLQGSLPRELAERLASSGTPLSPRSDEVVSTCGRDGQVVCPHVVAVHRAVGLRLDRTPTELLTLRGKPPSEVLHDVRAARGDEIDDAGELAVSRDEELGRPRGDLGAIRVHPEKATDPGWLLRHLGDPPGVDDVDSITDLIERAAAGAWRLAAGEGASHADVELLLGELRARRMASAAVLAEALGRDVESVQDELDELYAAGAVLRTGSGSRSRFRAVDS